MVKVLLPSILCDVTGKRQVFIASGTMKEVIDRMVEKYGIPLKEKMFDQEGELIRFWQIFVNGVNIHLLDYLETKVQEGDQIAILPAVGGG